MRRKQREGRKEEGDEGGKEGGEGGEEGVQVTWSMNTHKTGEDIITEASM